MSPYEFQALSFTESNREETRKAEVAFNLSLPKEQRERAVKCKGVKEALTVTTHRWEKGSSLLVF